MCFVLMKSIKGASLPIFRSSEDKNQGRCNYEIKTSGLIQVELIPNYLVRSFVLIINFKK